MSNRTVVTPVIAECLLGPQLNRSTVVDLCPVQWTTRKSAGVYNDKEDCPDETYAIYRDDFNLLIKNKRSTKNCCFLVLGGKRTVSQHVRPSK